MTIKISPQLTYDTIVLAYFYICGDEISACMRTIQIFSGLQSYYSHLSAGLIPDNSRDRL